MKYIDDVVDELGQKRTNWKKVIRLLRAQIQQNHPGIKTSEAVMMLKLLLNTCKRMKRIGIITKGTQP